MVENRPCSIAFLGVSTGHSSIHNVFTPWSECLGRKLTLVPFDLPLKSPASAFREFVTQFRAPEGPYSGALITSHKASLYDATNEMFDDLSAATRRLGEIGMIVKRGKQIFGDANDAISTKEVCNTLLGESRSWQTGCHEALILGGGGAGLAVANTLVTQKPLGCTSVTIVEADQLRAEAVRQRIASWRSDVLIQVVETDGTSDSLVSAAGPGSLIANATGLGKDRPGSPVSDSVVFPLGAHVWEFNYRFVTQSKPSFLETAARQAVERDLTVRDGWDYFVCGWLVVMATACALPVERYYPEFKRVADAARPSLARYGPVTNS